MQALQINYDLIGSFPQVEHLRNTLGNTIAEYRKSKYSVKQVLGSDICRAANHFYGISIEDYAGMNELIDAIQGMDQDLYVH